MALGGLFERNSNDSNKITAAPAVGTSDQKSISITSLNKKSEVEVVTEKADYNVEVSESTKTPAEPRRQRYARFLRSMFTKQFLLQTGEVLWKFGKFTGPGAIISVAYIDPDNYQTAVSSGAEFKFKLLFMILFSNVVAVYLQVRMGWSEWAQE
jgi:metal iron transporter